MKWLQYLLIILVIGCLFIPLPAQAANPTVTITVNAWVVGAPTNFTITLVSTIEAIDSSTVNITWAKGLAADNTTIMCKIDEYPADYTDGYLVYSGNGTTANMTGLSLERYRYFFVHGESAFRGIRSIMPKPI